MRLAESLRGTETAVAQRRDAESDLAANRKQHANQIAHLETLKEQLEQQASEAAERIIAYEGELVSLRQELGDAKDQNHRLELKVKGLSKVHTIVPPWQSQRNIYIWLWLSGKHKALWSSKR